MDYFNTFDNLISPRLTMRAEDDAPAKYENCFFELPGAGAKKLEEYYDDMDGADNPFSAITIEGTKGKQWKWTANGNLRLNHNKINILESRKSGAARLKVKSGYAVKLRITVGEEDFILGKKSKAPTVREQSAPVNSGKGLTRRERYIRSAGSEWDEVIEWPVMGRDDSPLYGKEQVDVVLVGDSGDYLSMDLEGQWDGIAKFRLKLGNETYANVGTGDINGNSYIKLLGVCKIDETSESGTNIKLETYKGYPIWRDERSTPFKIDVKGNITGLTTVFTQTYSAGTEQSAAVGMAKVWIDSQVISNGGSDEGGSDEGGSDEGGSDDGGSDDGGSDDGGSDDDEWDTNLGACPDNASQNDAGQCECDAGYKLDSNTQTCVKKEDSMSNYIVLGGLALLGLALLG
tara:strand:+ start:10173 stop:11381 length:1209 start_codon:yes stop_codon:yes gene_type:complete